LVAYSPAVATMSMSKLVIAVCYPAAATYGVFAAWADSRARRSATARDVCLISGGIGWEVN